MNMKILAYKSNPGKQLLIQLSVEVSGARQRSSAPLQRGNFDILVVYEAIFLNTIYTN